MQDYPHKQMFNKEQAVEAMQERIRNSKVGHKKLLSRQKAYKDTAGTTKPGSNKK